MPGLITGFFSPSNRGRPSGMTKAQRTAAKKRHASALLRRMRLQEQVKQCIILEQELLRAAQTAEKCELDLCLRRQQNLEQMRSGKFEIIVIE